MKKTFAALALGLALAMPLAGCSGNNDTAGGEDKTGSMTTFPPGGGITSGVTGDTSRASDYGYGSGRSSTRNPGTDDLAGADGIVGGSGGNNTGGTAGMSTGAYGHGDAANGGGIATGRYGGAATHDPIARMGQGIENTLDNMGDAARDMGQDARQMLR